MNTGCVLDITGRYRRCRVPTKEHLVYRVSLKLKNGGNKMSCERHREIRRRRQRKKKIHKLRARLAETTNPSEQARITAQIRRISPYAPILEDRAATEQIAH